MLGVVAMKIRDTSPKAKRIRDTSKTLPRVDHETVAKALGAEPMMSRPQALEELLTLCKKGIRWIDQFMGHGHYEFQLTDGEFARMLEVMRVADWYRAHKSRKQ